MHSRITVGALCAAILLLPACGPSYQRKALMPLCEKMAQYEETKNGVRLRARQMHKGEADSVFNGRGRYLYSSKNPIYPIRISVANNTTEPISCDPTQTTLISACPQDVCKRLQHNTALRTIGILGLGAAGLVAFTLFMGVYLLPLALWSATAYNMLIGGIWIGAGMLVLTPTAGVYYAINWSQENKQIAQDICAKSGHSQTANGTITIAPHEEFSYILFADGTSFKPQFDVTINTHNALTVFNVDLEQQKNA